MRTTEKKGWIDVSIPLRNNMVVWPGDPAVKIARVLDRDGGDECTLSKLSLSSHTGTHIDAPLHYLKGGRGVDTMPFNATIGICRIIEITDEHVIAPHELLPHRIRRGERILFKTKKSARCRESKPFVEDFVYISRDAAQMLAELQVMTVGIDSLSVGGFHKDGSETHAILLQAGIWIVEGLDLSPVEGGRYRLICLPLRIENGDGAPARAIVKRLEEPPT
ncbi:MAG: cyclase family protein [bacterium]